MNIECLSPFYDFVRDFSSLACGSLPRNDTLSYNKISSTMSFRRSEATRNLCAGGRSGILAKAKASFCVWEEARRRMPGDPAAHHTKTA